MLADNPGLRPNQIKARLLGNTNPGPVGNPFVDGHGALNAYAAATSGPMNFNQSAAGLIPASLGATISLSPTSPVDTWNASLWSGLSMESVAIRWAGRGTATGWNGADWNGWTWSGRAWNDDAWTGAAWNGEDWTGRAWNDAAWDGSVWDGSAWDSSSLGQLSMELTRASR